MIPPASIRLYQAKDANSLRAICKETAWPSYQKDPMKLETVPINFLDYFLEQEPEHVWVAVNEKDEAVGYIECATSYRRFVKAMKRIYMPRLKAYDQSQIAFEKKGLFALFFIRRWPCHLHINLTAAYQHGGLGSRLIDALIAQLRQEGFTRLAICGVKRGSDSYGFYRHYGFQEIFVYPKGWVSLGIRF
jgi:GNAT superfamily N-acetyltransferase